MRVPAVAGTFYPKDKEVLEALLQKLDASVNIPKMKAVSGVAPHAGYTYSGKIATYTHKAIKMSGPKTVVIVGPDHVGLAASKSEIAVYPKGEWYTPLGNLTVDGELAERIIEEIPEAIADESAHEQEHSIEVQLPMLKYYLGDVKIVPIMMGSQDMNLAVELGEKLAEIEPKAFVLASSDMSHYVPVDVAKEQDLKALGYLTEMDEVNFYRMIASGVSACGYGPATTAMSFARTLGVERGEVLAYGTSSDVTHDQVCVGYASVVFRSPVV